MRVVGKACCILLYKAMMQCDTLTQSEPETPDNGGATVLHTAPAVGWLGCMLVAAHVSDSPHRPSGDASAAEEGAR